MKRVVETWRIQRAEEGIVREREERERERERERVRERESERERERERERRRERERDGEGERDRERAMSEEPMREAGNGRTRDSLEGRSRAMERYGETVS